MRKNSPIFLNEYIPHSSQIIFETHFNPLALELDIYSLAHHLCKMWIFYEPGSVTLGNTRYFVEE